MSALLADISGSWPVQTFASLRPETQTRELLERPWGNDQAANSRRAEDEAQRGFGHGLLSRVGASSKPLDRGEELLVQIAAVDVGGVREATTGGGFSPKRYLPVSSPPASGLKAV